MSKVKQTSTRDGLNTLLDVLFGRIKEYQLEEFLGRHPWLAGLMAAGVNNGGYTREMVCAHLPNSFQENGEHANFNDGAGLMEFLAATTKMLGLRPLPAIGSMSKDEKPVIAIPARPMLDIPKPGGIASAIVQELGDSEQALATLTKYGSFSALQKHLNKLGIKVRGSNLRLVMKRYYNLTAESLHQCAVTSLANTPTKRKLVKRSKPARRKQNRRKTRVQKKNDKYAHSATRCLYEHFGGKTKAKTELPKALMAAGSVKQFTAEALKWPEMKGVSTRLSAANVHFILKNLTGKRVGELFGSRK